MKKNTKELQLILSKKNTDVQEELLDINPENLEFEDLERLRLMNVSRAQTATPQLVLHESDSYTVELLNYSTSILSILLTDYHVKLQVRKTPI